jgi:hypothetical protein
MSLEQGPKGPEKTIVEKITGFKDDFENWLKESPEIAEQLKTEVLRMAGVEENQLIDPEMGYDFGLIKVPTPELSVFGTGCGVIGNKPFSEKVISFLQSKGVEFIIGLGENSEPKVASAAINISLKDAEKFGQMIMSNEGSLRADPSKVKGWSVFESE